MNNWMKMLPDETIISEINLPGTHDSATRFVQFPYFAKCQSLSIPQQLKIGVRFLDLRVEKYGDKLRLVHSSAKCFKTASHKGLLLLEDVISECEKFLKSNPSETLIISIKRDAGDSAESTFDTLFEKYLNTSFWYQKNEIPTLKEVRGKAVFMNRFNVNSDNEKYTDFNVGLNFSNWPDQSVFVGKTHIESVMENVKKEPLVPIFIQDWYKLSPKKKWKNAIMPTIMQPPCENGIFLSFFSTSTLFNNPRLCARYIHKRFACTRLVPSKKYGWMIFDFPTEEICKKIIGTNF